jgi:hypothetical protein
MLRPNPGQRIYGSTPRIDASINYVPGQSIRIYNQLSTPKIIARMLCPYRNSLCSSVYEVVNLPAMGKDAQEWVTRTR